MKVEVREPILALLFLIPACIGVAALYYYPIVQTLIYSMHDLHYTLDWIKQPATLQNYLEVLHSANFWQSFRYTVYFTVIGVSFQLLIGLGMALAAFGLSPVLRIIVRVMIVIPWVIPPIISAMIWKWLFNTDVGLIGYILVRCGLVAYPPAFLSIPILAKHCIILADIWKWSSLMAMFLIGGLAAIPQDIYDAAEVDGARPWFRFRKVTLPALLPTISVAVLFRSMDALRTFDIIYGLTGGGPGTATETLSSFAYKFCFEYGKFGIGSAYAMVVFLLIGIIAVLYVSRIQGVLRFRK